VINRRFEELSQSLRVFTEQFIRIRPLLLIDAAEAVGNLDLAASGILNAFHGLRDAVTAAPDVQFQYYDHPFCSFTLNFRNARHHNNGQGIRSIYNSASEEAEPVNYLLVDFQVPDGEENGNANYAGYHISWSDFTEALAALPNAQRIQATALIRDAVCADDFENFARDEGYEPRTVFINSIPLIIGACSECVGAITGHIQPRSVEATFFLEHFQNLAGREFNEHDFTELTSAVFWPL